MDSGHWDGRNYNTVLRGWGVKESALRRELWAERRAGLASQSRALPRLYRLVLNFINGWYPIKPCIHMVLNIWFRKYSYHRGKLYMAKKTSPPGKPHLSWINSMLVKTVSLKRRGQCSMTPSEETILWLLPYLTQQTAKGRKENKPPRPRPHSSGRAGVLDQVHQDRKKNDKRSRKFPGFPRS